MTALRLTAIAAAALSLAACAYQPVDVADPRNITLHDAVMDVANTLNDVRTLTRNRPKSGLLIDEATVIFNISAKANDSRQLGLNGSLPASVGWPLSFTSQYQLQNEGNRGNQITLKFRNIRTTKLYSVPPDLAKCDTDHPPPGCPMIMKKDPKETK